MNNIFKEALILLLRKSWLLLLTFFIIFSFYVAIAQNTNKKFVAESSVYVYNNSKFEVYTYEYFTNILKNTYLAKDFVEFTKTDFYLNKLQANFKKSNLHKLNIKHLQSVFNVINLDNSRIILIQAEYSTAYGAKVLANEAAFTLKTELAKNFNFKSIKIINTATSSTRINPTYSPVNIFFVIILCIVIWLTIISTNPEFHKLFLSLKLPKTMADY